MNEFSEKVFLSYAREDSKHARHLYKDLKNHGVDVWLDIEDLLPGAKWQYEIRNIIKKGFLFFGFIIHKFNYKKRLCPERAETCNRRFAGISGF